MTERTIPTDLPDLTDVSLAQLRENAGHPEIEAARETLRAQIDKPRINIGTGPPGRAD